MSYTLEELIKNAKIEIEVERIIKDQGFRHNTTCKVGYDELFEYFKKNYYKDLSFYKLSKNSGYDVVVLYKGIAMVGVKDFTEIEAKEIENSFQEVYHWPTYQKRKLKVNILEQILKDPWDNRSVCRFKPSAEKIWCTIEQLL